MSVLILDCCVDGMTAKPHEKDEQNTIVNGEPVSQDSEKANADLFHQDDSVKLTPEFEEPVNQENKGKGEEDIKATFQMCSSEFSQVYLEIWRI